MPDVLYPIRLPFTGDVSQAINPWTWGFRSDGLQVGFLNVNLGKSADPQLEQRILDDVGSYGRQLGRMAEALEVVLDRVKLDGLQPGEAEALQAFRCQLAEVKRLKRKYGVAARD